MPIEDYYDSSDEEDDFEDFHEESLIAKHTKLLDELINNVKDCLARSRKNIIELLEQQLAPIADYFNHRKKHDSISELGKFSEKLLQLQELLWHYYLQEKDQALIELLHKHKIPLIAEPALVKYDSTVTKLSADIYAAHVRLMQRGNRHNIHTRYFSGDPLTAHDLSLDEIPSLRLQGIVKRMTNKHADYPVINHQVFHWTVLSNFKSILRNQAFYGSQTLQSNNIIFYKNALGLDDISNGDGDVICFSPALVDSTALVSPCSSSESMHIKSDLIRLTLDLKKLPSLGSLDCFFKIYDFNSPFLDITFAINEALMVRIIKKPTVNFSIILKLHNEFFPQVYIPRSEAVFYGTLSQINRFCIIRLLGLFKQYEASQLKLYHYLESQPDDEIIKILTIWAQLLTLFSEYNINHSLPLTPFLIREIYFAETNKKVTVNHGNIEAYTKSLNSIFDSSAIQEAADTAMPKLNIMNRYLSYEGFIIKYRNISGEGRCLSATFNFVQWPGKIFTLGEYVETRYQRITVKVDTGFGNAIYITGSHQKLGEWKTAYRLVNVNADTWQIGFFPYQYNVDDGNYELDTSLQEAEIKFLFGDFSLGKVSDIKNLRYEKGANRCYGMGFFDLSKDRVDLNFSREFEVPGKDKKWNSSKSII